MRVSNGGRTEYFSLHNFSHHQQEIMYFCTVLFNRCLKCDVPLFNEVGGEVLSGKMFVCKTSHFCQFLKRGEKASFLSTISCSFLIFQNMSECSQYSLGST